MLIIVVCLICLYAIIIIIIIIIQIRKQYYDNVTLYTIIELCRVEKKTKLLLNAHNIIQSMIQSYDSIPF